MGGESGLALAESGLDQPNSRGQVADDAELNQGDTIVVAGHHWQCGNAETDFDLDVSASASRLHLHLVLGSDLGLISDDFESGATDAMDAFLVRSKDIMRDRVLCRERGAPDIVCSLNSSLYKRPILQ